MLKFSKKPLMIAAGCSFTDPNFKSLPHPELDTSWDKWPDIFAKQHGYDLVNVGRSGAGNEYIADAVIDAVNKNPDVKFVSVLWSGWDRFRIYRTFFCPLSTASIKTNEFSEVLSEDMQIEICRNEPNIEIKYEISKLVIQNFFDKKATNTILNSNMRSMWILQDFLKRRNIKYIFAQGVSPIQFSFFNDNFINKALKPLLNNFLEHMYYDDLDNSNFYGWPLIPHIGGTHLDSMIYKISKNGEELKISNLDGHPNSRGQEELAKVFSEAYQKNYA